MDRLQDTPQEAHDSSAWFASMRFSGCNNAGAPLLQALNSLLSCRHCVAASAFFVDENAARVYLALFPSERGLEARQLSVHVPQAILSLLNDGVAPAALISGTDASPLTKAIFPNVGGIEGAAIVAAPVRLSAKRAVLLAGLIFINALPQGEGGSELDEVIGTLGAIAKNAAQEYARAADAQAMPSSDLGFMSFGEGEYSAAVIDSQIMKEKLAVVKAVADSSSPVLFIGERGTGKEFYARKLHSLSRRSSEPFVRVNCPAFSDAALAKLIFGGEDADAEEGGAAEAAGLLQKAKGGTVLLRGIESLSLSLQARLMEALQSGGIEKNGGTTPILARITASTDYDLEKLVAAKKFRADLYYALSVIPLYLPPLAARRDDIISLAYLFLKEASAETHEPFLFFSAGAEDALLTYSWPGNIRELKNAIARACVCGAPPCVTEENLLLNNHAIPDYNDSAERSLKSAVTLFKKRYVTRILAENGWNQTATAKVLRIQRTYLSRLIKELKIREQ